MAEANQHLINKQGNDRVLPPISIGEHVWVQNQATNRWDRSGTVIEALDYRRYTIKLDGSGRLSQRNRKHLKVIDMPPATDTESSDTSTPIDPQVTRPRRQRRRPDRFGCV